eukprot:2746535-Ditylum_brightwellii.AAC.1
MVEKEWFFGNQQEYSKRLISLILNPSVEGGSATDITMRFDYALDLASQLEVNVPYSEVDFLGSRP